MIERRLISEDDRELYLYGLQLLSERLIGLCSMVIVCVLLSRFFEGLVFYLGYSLLRKYAGGFHAEKFITCYLSSVVTMVFCCVLSYIPFAMNICAVLGAVSVVIIFLLAPVEHSAKPLDEQEVKRYRKFTRLLLIGEVCLFASLLLFEWYSLCVALSFAWVLLSVLLIMQCIRNKKSICYKTQ